MKKWMLGLVAAVVIACSPAQVANDIKVLNAIDVGCATAELAGSVIPPGTPVSIVAVDVAIACNIIDAGIPELEKIITSFESQPSVADAGAPVASGATYKPAAWAVPIIAAKKAARGARAPH
jgi:hypothetical protein